MNKTIVTTTHKPDAESVILGRQAASSLNTVFVDRQRMSLEKLREVYSCVNVLVIKNSQLTLFSPLGEYFFHPSMSVPRIKAIKEGKTDHMVDAMQLISGDTVLDCTMGLGADAIVAAYVSGSMGKITALESSPEIAYIVGQGLKSYNDKRPYLKEAMSRIDVINENYNSFLIKLQENSFDIVYFDPMFRFPRQKSSSMEPLRGVVNPAPIELNAIKHAIRVARKRVILKENWFSKEFERLGFKRLSGGRYSPIAFGIIDKEESG